MKSSSKFIIKSKGKFLRFLFKNKLSQPNKNSNIDKKNYCYLIIQHSFEQIETGVWLIADIYGD